MLSIHAEVTKLSELAGGFQRETSLEKVWHQRQNLLWTAQLNPVINNCFTNHCGSDPVAFVGKFGNFSHTTFEKACSEKCGWLWEIDTAMLSAFAESNLEVGLRSRSLSHSSIPNHTLNLEKKRGKEGRRKVRSTHVFTFKFPPKTKALALMGNNMKRLRIRRRNRIVSYLLLFSPP